MDARSGTGLQSGLTAGNPARKPPLQRVIWRTIPSTGNRRALMERGDADISFDLPPKDVAELAKERQAQGGRHADRERDPVYRACTGHQEPPFDNVKVRQAVASALPYQQIMDAATFGRGTADVRRPARGHTSRCGRSRNPYTTDLAKAKQLLSEAGYPDGFETTLSFDLGFAVTNEPLSILVQESLAQIGIKTSLNKIPGANWRAELSKKTLPLITNVFRRLAQLSGILLLLDLSRPERDFQHDVLPEPGNG